jgi:hypothetical protein
MEITPDIVKSHLPYYLTQDAKNGVLKELQNFHLGKMQYLLPRGLNQEILQGDGWRQLQLLNFDTGERVAVNGIILSNTCDIALENKRDLPIKIVFAPLIRLSLYTDRLVKAGVSGSKIGPKIEAIKQQRITNIFYVPTGATLDDEHIVLLDDVHTMPAKVFEKNLPTCKIFTLNQAGFYLFILKLSIHFCRFHEEVARS